ncbi:uncharacterized protein TRAVEDRAFT_54549 [Trametes versicolor FP-101664 SS1]|uniref:Uncharacterized protein n=1 Tax=Trametes versicolor (strain FP-101664) TaxID=717944 RepID=R7S911_TRAVS|nr:uncharacterized protein TRAVEDRAFT_54549 [Trametes versicolor FP-101664 SS1]EIW51459.1 hypothetical protein TRAVEDRAFT_54549 [Trametes versicolor FP-101664 SS1]
MADAKAQKRQKFEDVFAVLHDKLLVYHTSARRACPRTPSTGTTAAPAHRNSTGSIICQVSARAAKERGGLGSKVSARAAKERGGLGAEQGRLALRGHLAVVPVRTATPFWVYHIELASDSRACPCQPSLFRDGEALASILTMADTVHANAHVVRAALQSA